MEAGGYWHLNPSIKIDFIDKLKTKKLTQTKYTHIHKEMHYLVRKPMER